MTTQRHHIAQDKYLLQWKKSGIENQLNIYVIPENKYIERGPGWKGFWREDFNVLKDEQEKSYLPEEVSAIIDTKGIEAIRKIDTTLQPQLDGMDRSAIAFYTALQYVRTPRYREESDKMMKATVQEAMRQSVTSPDKVTITKEELLSHVPVNKEEEKAMDEVRLLSEEEIKKLTFETMQKEDFIAGLTTTGHSKMILKTERQAAGLFEVQWMFLIAPKGSLFITSDNPCFAISPTKVMNGLLSPTSTVIFPLRPDVCLYIKPGIKSQVERYMAVDKKQVKDINKAIIAHSYDCVVAKDLEQLKSLTKDFDNKSHRKSRDVQISKSGPYTMFNLE